MKKSKKLVVLLAVCAMAGIASANLLTNGSFNVDADADGVADGWSPWSWGGGWSNLEVITPAPALVGVYDGSLQMSMGAGGSGGGGIYQVVAGTEGLTYTLNVEGGAQDWWLPIGEITLQFQDAAGADLGTHQINTTDSIHNPDLYDTGVQYQDWSMSAVAPTGTTQIKVEFAERAGTGTAWFDNAVLIPEPATLVILGLGGLLLRRKK